MQALGRQRPEIPHRGWRAQIALGMALLGMDEVGELVWVAHEEHRRVVADEIPVALLGVELDREAAHVAFGIRGTELAGYGRETQDQGGPGAGLQHLGPGVLRDIAADGQRAVRTPALGVHRTFRNALAVLVCELLKQWVVLQQQWAAGAGAERILVVGNQIAGGGGQLIGGWLRRVVGWFAHGEAPLVGVSPRYGIAIVYGN